MATSLEVGGWRTELEGLLARFGRLFVRAEPREQAGRYLEGLLAPVERKNGWQLAEAIGDARPWRTQRVLSHVLWDEAAARDLVPRPRRRAPGGAGRRPGRGRDRLREEGRALGRRGAAVLRHAGQGRELSGRRVPGLRQPRGARADRPPALPAGGLGRGPRAPQRGQGARGRAVPDQARDRARDGRPGAGRWGALRLGAGGRGVRRRPAAAPHAGAARQALPPDRP